MFGARNAVVRHLAFDNPGVEAVTPRVEKFEQHLRRRLVVCVVKYLRGKNPGGMPLCGVPPGGCE